MSMQFKLRGKQYSFTSKQPIYWLIFLGVCFFMLLAPVGLAYGMATLSYLLDSGLNALGWTATTTDFNLIISPGFYTGTLITSATACLFYIFAFHTKKEAQVNVKT